MKNNIKTSPSNSPDLSVEQATSDELIKLILKLRWMGMESEAKDLENKLSLRPVAPADSVLATPHDTD